MVGTRKLARLLDHADAAGAKVVLVGDPRQLPEIDAGGLLAGLAERLPGVQLTENRRQRDAWERQALAPPARRRHRHRHRRATATTAASPSATTPRTPEPALSPTGGPPASPATTSSCSPAAAPMSTTSTAGPAPASNPPATFTDRRSLIDGTPFQAGDEVMTLRNDRRLRVRNGGARHDRCRRPAAAPSLSRSGPERRVALPADYLAAGHVTHAYAMTVHKAQGPTCDRAFTLGTDNLYREQGYVAMSRGRLSNHLYIVGPRPLDPDGAAHAPTQRSRADELLATGLATSKAQSLAVDHLADPSLLIWTIGDLFAEQRRLRGRPARCARGPQPRRRVTHTHS